MVNEITKSEAQRMADKILGPINAAVSHASADTTFDQFVELEFFPWFRRKWKTSTRGTTEDRINRHLVPRFKGIPLGEIKPTQLQQVLDEKANQGFSRNTVNHLRWDMKQIFEYAVSSGILPRNPAADAASIRSRRDSGLRQSARFGAASPAVVQHVAISSSPAIAAPTIIPAASTFPKGCMGDQSAVRLMRCDSSTLFLAPSVSGPN